MITLAKTTLQEAMKKCMPGVETGSSLIVGADAFLFTPGYLHTYNDTIAVSTPLTAEGLEGAVKAADLYKLVTKINAPMINIEVNGPEVNISGGRTKARMTMIDATRVQEYINTLGLDAAEWKKLPGGFMEAVTLCKLSCNPSPLRGIAVAAAPDGQNAQVMSTDQSRISVGSLQGPMDPLWIDDPVVNDLMKLGDPTDYAMGGPWLHLKYADGTIFSCKLKDCAQFPVTLFNTAVTAAQAVPAILAGRLPKDLLEATGRVATMASGIDGSSASLVRLTFKKDGLELYAKKDTGDASELVPWDTPLETDPNRVAWVDTSFLMEAGRKAMDFKLVHAEGSETDTMVFTSEGFTQLVSTDVIE